MRNPIQDATDVVQSLNELYEITSLEGKWLNIQQFQELAKKLPDLIEKADETLEFMKEHYNIECECQPLTDEQRLHEVGMSYRDFI